MGQRVIDGSLPHDARPSEGIDNSSGLGEVAWLPKRSCAVSFSISLRTTLILDERSKPCDRSPGEAGNGKSKVYLDAAVLVDRLAILLIVSLV